MNITNLKIQIIIMKIINIINKINIKTQMMGVHLILTKKNIFNLNLKQPKTNYLTITTTIIIIMIIIILKKV